MTIIAYALGVGDSDLETFKRWSDDLVMPVGNPSPSVDQVRSYLISSTEFADFFGEMLAARRIEARSDLISDVANAEVNGERLSEAEMLSMLQQFLVAGNETTTKLLTNMIHILAITPGLEDQLRQDRSLIPGFVEESLRFEAPVGGLFRMATADFDLGGNTVAKGDHVWIIYAAGNRDGEQFEEPDHFDACRENARDHLSFGHGEHFCIGASLARAEARIAVEKVLDHMRNIRLSPTNDFLFEDTFVLRGLRSLHIEFDSV